MSKIAIVTDSNSSIPRSLAAQKGITIVPAIVQFGEEAFLSEETISEAQVFDRIDREGKLPKTAAPAPGVYTQAYQAAFDKGAEAVICYCVSSEVSAIYNSALNALNDLPGKDVTVVDTRTLSIGQGFQVLAAADAASAGASKDDILALTSELNERTQFFAALATLKYLVMGGRVSHLAGSVASLLNVKPILTIRDGKLDILEKVRTRSKAWDRLVELAGNYVSGKQVERMAVVHSNAPDDALAFEKMLRDAVPCPEDILITSLTAALSCHSGSGIVGVGITLK